MERLTNLLFSKSKVIIGFVAIMNLISVISFFRCSILSHALTNSKRFQ